VVIEYVSHASQLNGVVHKKPIIGIEPSAENDGLDMFEQAGLAAE